MGGGILEGLHELTRIELRNCAVSMKCNVFSGLKAATTTVDTQKKDRR